MPYPKRGRGAGVTPEKAKTILKDGTVRGHPLTSKQKGFFGARAGGAPMKPMADGITTMAPRNPPGRKLGRAGY